MRSENQVSVEDTGLEEKGRDDQVQALISEGRPGVEPPLPLVGKGVSPSSIPSGQNRFLENIMFNFSGNVASHQA